MVSAPISFLSFYSSPHLFVYSFLLLMVGILRKVLWALLSSTLWKTAAPAEQNRTPPLFLHTPFICYCFFFFLKLENNRHRHQKGKKKKHAAALRGNENQKRRRGRRGTSFFQLLEISPRQCGRFVCVHRMRVLTTSDQDPQRQTEVNSRTDPHSCSFFSVFFPHFFRLPLA